MTSREFAQLIGVSQATVSRALNGSTLVSEKTRQYVVQKAADYGFVLNSQARSLKTSKTGTVGVMFPLYFDSLSKNLMFTNIYDHLQRELSKRDIDAMVIYDYENPAAKNTLERVVKSLKVDGIINFRPQLLPEEIGLIEEHEIPFVSLHSGRQDHAALHQFMIDEEYAGEEIGRYYGRLDGERYIFISTQESLVEQKGRFHGFQKGLAAYGKRLREADILACPLSMDAAREETLRRRDLFTGGNTSIFVYNDMMAVGVLNALHMLGVPVPQRAQIVSMDDIPLASWVYPRLTTLRAPVQRMVKDGCDRLLALIDGQKAPPQTVYYRSQMILRDTTR